MNGLQARVIKLEEAHTESSVAQVFAPADACLRPYSNPKDLLRVLLDQSGQDLIEYALLIALVALSVTAGVKSVATKVSTACSNIGTTLVGYSAGSSSPAGSGSNGNGAGNGQGNNGNNSGNGNKSDNGNGTGNGNNGNGNG